MAESDDDFFAGKRSWSIIKDQVLKDYMAPYLAKVNRLNRPILLIDGYAGPGVFGDRTLGSPLIMCEAAEKYVKGNYNAIFINKDKKYHDKLYEELRQRGWLGHVQPLLGDSQQLLQTLPKTLKDQTVFLYLDPFGPTGCEFTLLQPFLDRNPEFSTEILLTLNMPGMPRLAARHAVKDGREEEQIIKNNHLLLTKVFGGGYWKDILLQQSGTSEERELRLVEAYRAKLAQYLPFTGACPVRERTDRRIKYFIVFASRHQHAMLLLNDVMAKAYFAGMHKADLGDGLWEDTDWREMRSIDGIDRVIIDIVAKHQGETRASIWFRIIQKHFMRYLKTEYHSIVKRLISEKKLITPNPGKTGQLNDDCKLYLP